MKKEAMEAMGNGIYNRELQLRRAPREMIHLRSFFESTASTISDTLFAIEHRNFQHLEHITGKQPMSTSLLLQLWSTLHWRRYPASSASLFSDLPRHLGVCKVRLPKDIA